MAKWQLQSIDFDTIERSKVSDRLLRLAKTSSLVEYNSADYVTYLNQVFDHQSDIKADFEVWGEEERQHGLALRYWVERVDPSFDFEAALKRFQSAFRIPLEADKSVRGSKAGELVARCMVESGTSSYYAALRDASTEPVLKKICQFISTDEVQHFNLFYRWLEKLMPQEGLGRLKRIKIALERSLEVEDEELSFAYAAANLPEEKILKDRLPDYNREFLSRAYGIYEAPHMRLAIRLAFKAAGVRPRPWATGLAAKAALSTMKRRSKKLLAA